MSASTDAAGTTVTPRVRWDDAGVLEITKWQLEEVTGQTIHAPSEYVSTGVESAPYHGDNIDGVKTFTTLNGNTVASTGIVTEATGPEISSSTAQFAELDGVAGSHISSPDSAAASITSSITLVAYVAPSDWTPAALEVYISKYNISGNQRAIYFGTFTDGKLRFVTSVDGTAIVTSDSTAATGFANGTGHWIRVTWNDTTDKSNFYTSGS